MTTPDDAIISRVWPDARLIRATPLTGGVSAQVTLLELALPDGITKKVVLRQHGPVDLASNPNIAQDEYALLATLHAQGLPVPAPHHVDAGHILLDYIEGETDFAPSDLAAYLDQAAALLARIHSIDATMLEGLSLRKKEFLWPNRPQIVDDSLYEGRIYDALAAIRPRSANEISLIHGDYWPGNLLWRDNALVGVIDWEDAGIGDPLLDLANSRLECLWAFGTAAMERFTDSYMAQMPSLNRDDLPGWELWAALRKLHQFSAWAEDAAARDTMRARFRWFVMQALDAL